MYLRCVIVIFVLRKREPVPASTKKLKWVCHLIFYFYFRVVEILLGIGELVSTFPSHIIW
jgi:hypothetical protein